jgi:hypothetical protein
MSAKITITKILLASQPQGQQICTVKYQYINPVDSPIVVSANNVVVAEDGTLPIAHIIGGLQEAKGVRLIITNNCNGEEFTQVVFTASNVCPDVIGIIGSVQPQEGGGEGAPSFIEVSNVVSGSTRTHVFEVGAIVPNGTKYNLAVYSHIVSVIANNDTADSIIQKLVNAINNTTEGQWNEFNSAPVPGTPGFKPVAVIGNPTSRISIVVNVQNQFAAWIG